MNTLESFTAHVKTKYEAQKSHGSFHQEVYERLTNDEDYTIFQTPFELRKWLVEKYTEACEAQWNNLQVAIIELLATLDTMSMCARHIMHAMDELNAIVSRLDLSGVVDRETALDRLKAVLNNM